MALRHIALAILVLASLSAAVESATGFSKFKVIDLGVPASRSNSIAYGVDDMFYVIQDHETVVAANVTSGAIHFKLQVPMKTGIQLVASRSGYLLVNAWDLETLMGFSPTGEFLWSQGGLMIDLSSGGNYRHVGDKIYFYDGRVTSHFTSLCMKTGIRAVIPHLSTSVFVAGTESVVMIRQQEPNKPSDFTTIVIYDFASETVLLNATNNYGGTYHGTQGGKYYFLTNYSDSTREPELLIYTTDTGIYNTSNPLGKVWYRTSLYDEVGGLPNITPRLHGGDSGVELLTIVWGWKDCRMDVLNLTSGVVQQQVGIYGKNKFLAAQIATTPDAIVLWDQFNFTVYSYPEAELIVEVEANNTKYNPPIVPLVPRMQGGKKQLGLVLRSHYSGEVEVRSIRTGSRLWFGQFAQGYDGAPTQAVLPEINSWVVCKNNTAIVFKF